MEWEARQSRIDEFLDLYKQLEDVLEIKYRNARRHYSSVVFEFIKDDESAPVRDKLEICREIRNLLTHSANLEGEPVVEPSAPVVEAMGEVLDLVADVDFSVNVISKSGTTTEPAVAFRFFRAALEKKYGREGARERIYATTDKARGALKSLADSEGWETFVVPDDVGGRYSVLTAVGLLPIAVAGVDITALMQGAAEMMETCTEASFRCSAWRYAAIRYELYRAGRSIELLACYDPAFRFMAEWWKQLFGESEGKEGKGLFPASVEFTADLHSMGQYIQEGKRLMFETVVRLGPSDRQLTVPVDEADGDGLNFLAGKSLDFIRDRAMEGTLLAHTEGGVPNLIVETSGRTPADLGQLIYFFEYACGLSGYLLDVNPFDQPGVEAYKKNMFALLGKPGYEDRRAQLESKLEG